MFRVGEPVGHGVEEGGLNALPGKELHIGDDMSEMIPQNPFAAGNPNLLPHEGVLVFL
jgi:hypothetical protein